MNKVKIIIYIVIGLVMAGLITSTVILGNKYKMAQQELGYKTEQVDSLIKYNKELGELNGIQVNVTFQFTQKNVLSFSQSNLQNIAKDISQMTRKELLDSLYRNGVCTSK